ncbi:MAG: family transporter, partial [Ilumatobacteraceae bacterium]|nr:family transporter [Ilumatobacteraceae bacterium]
GSLTSPEPLVVLRRLVVHERAGDQRLLLESVRWWEPTVLPLQGVDPTSIRVLGHAGNVAKHVSEMGGRRPARPGRLTVVSSASINEQHLQFGPSEWSLSVGIAIIWGSSFLWIAIAIDHVETPVVPLARCVFGALALLCFPSARRMIRREDIGRFAMTGLVWMAIPFLLYPVAERTVNTSITGMMNGGLPVVTTIVTAIFTRRVPSARRIVAVSIGATGIAMISLASVSGDTGADVAGILWLLLALVCYAIAVNIARPVQATYGALASMLWIAIFGALWSLPLGIISLPGSDFDWAAIGSLVVLGAVGTGAAFAMYGVLLQRSGPVRGMIGIFFTPIVGLILGVTFRDDELHVIAIVGMLVVICGAMLTSRPEPAPITAEPTPVMQRS